MAHKSDTADPDLDALLKGASDATRLLALRRLADSGRADLKSLLEPIAQKDKSLTVRYLAKRVLRALDGAAPGFGDADPDPAQLVPLASGTQKRPTALVAALRDPPVAGIRDPLPTPVAGTRFPPITAPGPAETGGSGNYGRPSSSARPGASSGPDDAGGSGSYGRPGASARARASSGPDDAGGSGSYGRPGSAVRPGVAGSPPGTGGSDAAGGPGAFGGPGTSFGPPDPLTANTGPIPKDRIAPRRSRGADLALEDEATSPISARPPAATPAPPVDPEVLRIERAALSVLRPCVRQLTNLLEGADAELAAECALALGRLRATDAYDLIAGRARASPPDERYIKGLGEVGDPRAAEMLARFWGDSRWQGLKPAIGVAACRIRSTRAEEFLRTALKEDDLSVQGAIIRHLSATGDTRFVDALLAKLGRVQEFFEVLVIQALAKFAPTQPHVVSALLERLPREPNPRTASCIISSLAASGHPELADSIEKLTRQRDRRVRANAVDAVMRLTVPVTNKTRILRPLLEDDDNRVRANAARLMIQLGDRSALEVLKQMLAHKDKLWRASACHALGECRPPGTAALLGKMLRDPELDVRLNATKALRAVDDPAVPQLLLGLLADKNLYIRVHAMDALGNLRVKAAASALRGALRTESSPQGIAAALQAIARTCPADVALREIAPYLVHTASSVRLTSVEALEPVLDAESVGALKVALKDGDRRVRAAAVRTFFACGQLKVVSSLYDALLSDDRAEQIAVAHALGELAGVVFGWREAPPPERLLHALKKLPAYAPEDAAGRMSPGRSS